MQQITIEFSTRFGVFIMICSFVWVLSSMFSLYQTITKLRLEKKIEAAKIKLERMKNGEKFDEYGLPILARDIPMPKVKEPILENQFEIRLD